MGIRKGRLWIVLVTLFFSKAIILPQQRSPITSNQPDFPVGVWEAAQPDGSAVGIDLASVPVSVPDAVLPEGTTRQEGSRLQIGVFQKHHERIGCGEENFFIVGWTGAGASDSLVSYANRKLEIHSYDRVSHSEIHVELVLDLVMDVWTGHFHRERFDAQVALRRTSDRPDPAEGGCFVMPGVAQAPGASSVGPTLLLTSTGRPALFRVEMSNPGTQDLVLNLGFALANGRKQYLNAVEYTLTIPDGRVLHLETLEPALIAGRVDPVIVPLPAGATFSFLVDLARYGASKEKIWKLDLAPGRYTLQASYTGRAVSHVNLDCKGIVLMPYWVGTVTATPVVFKLPLRR